MTSPELTIHSYEQDSQIVLVLRGELDIASAPVFAHALTHTLEQRAAGILLDMSAVRFVDSTGLRAILAARALCAERSCELALTQPAQSVQRLFEVTGVLDELPRREIDTSHAGTVQIWPQRFGGSPMDAQATQSSLLENAVTVAARAALHGGGRAASTLLLVALQPVSLPLERLAALQLLRAQGAVLIEDAPVALARLARPGRQPDGQPLLF